MMRRVASSGSVGSPLLRAAAFFPPFLAGAALGAAGFPPLAATGLAPGLGAAGLAATCAAGLAAAPPPFG